MKNLIAKIWAAMCSVPQKYLWCAILGMFICTLIGVVFPPVAEWPFFAILIVAAVVGIVCKFADKPVNLLAFAWFAAGVMIPQILFWIA